MTKAIRGGLAGLLTAALFTWACDAGDPVSPTEGPQIPEQDLAPGSHGEGVRAVHAYLAKFGYLPNPDLQRQYPAWRPITPDLPADPSVYDQHSAAAVRALQAGSNLSVTGVVDSATRALMRLPRCGVPDGISDSDPANKFALLNERWSERTVSWRLVNAPVLNTTVVRQAIAGALSTWTNNSLELFRESSGTSADILVKFAAIDGPGNILAQN
jgi:peptidoglycan hydrolase-like protein with peptidoglycan-binding domain